MLIVAVSKDRQNIHPARIFAAPSIGTDEHGGNIEAAMLMAAYFEAASVLKVQLSVRNGDAGKPSELYRFTTGQ